MCVDVPRVSTHTDYTGSKSMNAKIKRRLCLPSCTFSNLLEILKKHIRNNQMFICIFYSNGNYSACGH